MSFPQMDYFRAIHGATGLKYAKDMRVAEYQARFAADFDSSINVVHNALRNDVAQDFIIIPTDTGCDLWARPGETFNIGDIIFYGTLHWLVTDVNFNDDLNRSGKMVRCNRQIRWQNRSTGEIVERWCLATKPYTSNIEEGMAIATSNREFKIQLTYDAETMLVDLDRRFLLEMIDGTPKAYQVTSVDTITNRYQNVDGGFLVWNLKQCEYNPVTDNAELMLADYFDAPEQSVVDAEMLRCEIDGKDNIRCGRSRTYRPVFYTATKEVNDAVAPVWTMVCDNPLVTGLVEDGSYVLSVADDDSADGSIVQLTLQDADNLYAPTTMKVEVSALL